MVRQFLRQSFLMLYLLSGCSAQFKPIFFPGETPSEVGDKCHYSSGNFGTCQQLSRCPHVRNSLRNGDVKLNDVICKKTRRQPIICCPTVSANTLDISKPEEGTAGCGTTWTDHGNVDLTNLYVGNATAKGFEEDGYNITILDMNVDDISVFEYTKGNGTKLIEIFYIAAAIGGFDARRILTVYMAILGDGVSWLCDGVLIHSQWVLTAAHCFNNQESKINIVRLGEYDLNNDEVSRASNPIDMQIAKVIINPDYKFPSVYHDLALVKLDRTVPKLRPDLRPICLPWGHESVRDLIGQSVTLTGWGATSFLGPNSPILQEVNVTVFDPLVCDASYSRLRDYKSKFPKGIHAKTSICAGDEEGGKDACQGDSGGPIVYQNSEGLFTLAGIVSTGNGCGLKDFPGIYVPLQNPEYLAWIKQVVFLKQ